MPTAKQLSNNAVEVNKKPLSNETAKIVKAMSAKTSEELSKLYKFPITQAENC